MITVSNAGLGLLVQNVLLQAQSSQTQQHTSAQLSCSRSTVLVCLQVLLVRAPVLGTQYRHVQDCYCLLSPGMSIEQDVCQRLRLCPFPASNFHSHSASSDTAAQQHTLKAKMNFCFTADDI